MSDFLMEIYKGLVEFLGWVVLCAAAIAGVAMGVNYGDSILWGILGFTFGVVGGFLVNALLLPPLLILFKIYDRLGTISDRSL